MLIVLKILIRSDDGREDGYKYEICISSHEEKLRLSLLQKDGQCNQYASKYLDDFDLE